MIVGSPRNARGGSAPRVPSPLKNQDFIGEIERAFDLLFDQDDRHCAACGPVLRWFGDNAVIGVLGGVLWYATSMLLNMKYTP
jgi:hypothetical protein